MFDQNNFCLIKMLFWPLADLRAGFRGCSKFSIFEKDPTEGESHFRTKTDFQPKCYSGVVLFSESEFGFQIDLFES